MINEDLKPKFGIGDLVKVGRISGMHVVTARSVVTLGRKVTFSYRLNGVSTNVMITAYEYNVELICAKEQV